MLQHHQQCFTHVFILMSPSCVIRNKADWEGDSRWWKYSKGHYPREDFHENDTDDVMAASYNRSAWCDFMIHKYLVIPGSTFGFLPLNYQKSWRLRACDYQFLYPVEEFRRNFEFIKEFSSNKEVIAILISTSSKTFTEVSVENHPLFIHSLPSIIRTANDDFNYKLFIGYDKEDEFFDSEYGLNLSLRWIEVQMKNASALFSWQMVSSFFESCFS